MELFEIELIICIKTDLALNNQQRLICHKTQTTNQPTKLPVQWPERSETEKSINK